MAVKPYFDWLGDVPQIKEWLGSLEGQQFKDELIVVRDTQQVSIDQYAVEGYDELDELTPEQLQYISASWTSNPYLPPGYDPTPAPPTHKIGDRPKDKTCKWCKNVGHVVLSSIDVGDQHWTCKLCGKEEVVK